MSKMPYIESSIQSQCVPLAPEDECWLSQDTGDKRKSPVYLAHKMGKQVGYWGGWVASNPFRAVSSYQEYAKIYHINPADVVFKGDPVTAIYRRDTPLEKTFESALLWPAKYRKDRLNSAELDQLHTMANGTAKWGSRIQVVGTGSRILGDAAVGAFFNGAVIYRGINGVNQSGNLLTQEQQTNMVVSGSLGLASSLCFMGYAFFVTPAGQPIAAIFAITAAGLIVMQTLWDERENIKEFLLSDGGAAAEKTNMDDLPQVTLFVDGFDMQGNKFYGPNFFPIPISPILREASGN